jgi:hypothetical protein
MIEVVAVHLVGGTSARHIASLPWGTVTRPGVAPEEPITESTRQQMVDFVRQSPGEAIALNPERTEYAVLVAVTGNPDYVRTAADDTPYDNLLSLPRY